MANLGTAPDAAQHAAGDLENHASGYQAKPNRAGPVPPGQKRWR